MSSTHKTGMGWLALLTSCFLFLIHSAAYASQTESLASLQDYARHAQFINIKISPQGDYLAASTRGDDGNVRLVVLNMETREVMSSIAGHREDSIGSFDWANNERLVISLVREVGAFEAPLRTGEIFAINADGSRRQALTGPNSPDQNYVMAEVFDWLPDDPNGIMIYEYSLRRAEPFLQVSRVLLNSGRKIPAGRIPLRYSREGGVQIISDDQGVPRVVVGVDPDDNSKRLTMVRASEDDEWEPLLSQDDLDFGFVPLAFTADPNQVVGMSRTQTNTTAISLLDLQTGEEEIIASHPDTDLIPMMGLKDGKPYDVIGAAYELDALETVFFSGSGDEAFVQTVMGLQNAFPDQSFYVTSATDDNQTLVIRVGSANQNDTFYLYNREDNHLAHLSAAAPWLSDALIPQTRTIVYEARDGLEIHALLTVPPGIDEENLPLIMLPHGGPHGVRDSLTTFDTDAKVFASHGYAVLQPNFRGSGGFGESFEQAGHRNWGTSMIDDMTDGVQHLVDEGIVDQQRVCAYGGSYGGYAALQSAIREPDLYKCTVGFVGVFDLDLMLEEGDIPERESGLRYLAQVLPPEGEERDAQSPIRNLDKLKAPVFLIHGAEDFRVPQIQADNLKAALEEREHPVEWMVKRTEGHGFLNPDNNVERWQRMLEFFDRYIGEDAD